MRRGVHSTRTNLRGKDVETKLKLCRNRIKALEIGIKKKQTEIEELQYFIRVHLLKSIR